MEPALQPRLGDLKRPHAGLVIDLQARIEPRDVKDCETEQGHDEHQHESHHEGAAPLIDERA